MTAIFDKNMELRDLATGAVTSTGVGGSSVPLSGRFAPAEFECFVHVAAIDGTSGDETYTVAVEVDSVADFTGTPTVIASVAIPRDTAVPAKIRVALNGSIVKALHFAADHIRVKHTLAGTTPSLTYGAYVTRALHGADGGVAHG